MGTFGKRRKVNTSEINELTKPGQSLSSLNQKWKKSKENWLEEEKRKNILAHAIEKSRDLCIWLWAQLDSSLTSGILLSSAPSKLMLWNSCGTQMAVATPSLIIAGGDHNRIAPANVSTHHLGPKLVTCPIPEPFPVVKGMGYSNWLNHPNHVTGKGWFLEEDPSPQKKRQRQLCRKK